MAIGNMALNMEREERERERDRERETDRQTETEMWQQSSCDMKDLSTCYYVIELFYLVMSFTPSNTCMMQMGTIVK